MHQLVPMVLKATQKTESDWWSRVVPQITVQVRAIGQKFDVEQAEEQRKRRQRREEAADYEWEGV